MSPLCYPGNVLLWPPHDYTEDNSEPPDVLELDFVYGMSTDKSRQCLMYAPDGDAMWFAGSTVIIMNQKRRSQNSIVITAVLSPQWQCTGSRASLPAVTKAKFPVIRIWNPLTHNGNALCFDRFPSPSYCALGIQPQRQNSGDSRLR